MYPQNISDILLSLADETSCLTTWNFHFPRSFNVSMKGSVLTATFRHFTDIISELQNFEENQISLICISCEKNPNKLGLPNIL